MMAGLITNGYLLSPKRIEGLNRAGLDYLQISIDNIEPDEVSKKSLKAARQEAAVARATSPSSTSTSTRCSAAASRTRRMRRTITRRARELGFSTSIGIIHDGRGQLKPLGPREREVWDDVTGQVNKAWQVSKNLYSGIRSFQAEPDRRKAERVAVPRRRALPLHLRERPGALLLAAARLSRHARSSSTPPKTSSASS